MASRASVNFSLVDSRAKKDWLPGRGALREQARDRNALIRNTKTP
jgi:hypothetical protein